MASFKDRRSYRERPSDIESEVRSIVPGGYVSGVNYCCRNPRRSDKKIGSFSIAVRGAKVGAWKDFANGDAGGSLYSFKKYIETGVIESPMDRKTYRDSNFLPSNFRKESAEAVLRRKEFMEKIWEKGYSESSLADYLVARGLDRTYKDVRFISSLRHAPSNRNFPAMICRICDDSGEMVGLHRTYLQTSGRKIIKCEEQPNKMMLGTIVGGYVFIEHKEVTGGHEIAICEGIETGMSVQKLYQCPVKCALSATNMVNMRAGINNQLVLICGDKDRAGRMGASKLGYKFSIMEKKYKIIYPAHGNDFNDELMERYARR